MASGKPEEELRAFFDSLDTNGDGILDKDEIMVLLRMAGNNPTDAEVVDVINAFDADGDGKISFEEFQTCYNERFAHIDPKAELCEAFKCFDKNGDGFIDLEEMLSNKEMFGEMTEEEAKEMISMADTDGDGKVNYEEFSGFLSGVES